MKLDDLTIAQAREIASLFNATQKPDDSHWRIGEVYFLRTVTMAHTGRLVKVTPNELVMTDAAWIADTGRFSDALASETFSEVEPFPAGEPVIVGRGSLVDAVRVSKVQISKK